ncbi:hypothetical protein AAY473_006423 [Plecturocebus cupreus]
MLITFYWDTPGSQVRKQMSYFSTWRTGECSLEAERKQAACKVTEPETKRQARELLGVVGFVNCGFPNFAGLTKPLYDLTKGGDQEPFEWGSLQCQAYQELKTKLMSAPALGLPDLTKPFTLYVAERGKVAVGVLVQTVGPWPRPVGYLSKQLDGVSKTWPPCFRALAVTALLAQEADKLTLGQNLKIKAPHAVVTLMNTRGHHWLSNVRLTKYQGLLCENPCITTEVCNTLNPSTLLSMSEGPIEHNCVAVLDTVYSSRADLQGQPWTLVDWELYVDGSSFGTLAQKAELTPLTQALELSKDKIVNIYTDSRYAFLTLQVHGTLYKEREMRQRKEERGDRRRERERK